VWKNGNKPVIPVKKTNGTVLFTGNFLKKIKRIPSGVFLFSRFYQGKYSGSPSLLPLTTLLIARAPAFRLPSRLSRKGLPAVSKAAINPRAFKWGKGVDAPLPPIRFLLNFWKTNNYLDLPFSVAVRISLRHILSQVW